MLSSIALRFAIALSSYPRAKSRFLSCRRTGDSLAGAPQRRSTASSCLARRKQNSRSVAHLQPALRFEVVSWSIRMTETYCVFT